MQVPTEYTPPRLSHEPAYVWCVRSGMVSATADSIHRSGQAGNGLIGDEGEQPDTHRQMARTEDRGAGTDG